MIGLLRQDQILCYVKIHFPMELVNFMICFAMAWKTTVVKHSLHNIVSPTRPVHFTWCPWKSPTVQTLIILEIDLQLSLGVYSLGCSSEQVRLLWQLKMSIIYDVVDWSSHINCFIATNIFSCCRSKNHQAWKQGSRMQNNKHTFSTKRKNKSQQKTNGHILSSLNWKAHGNRKYPQSCQSYILSDKNSSKNWFPYDIRVDHGFINV